MIFHLGGRARAGSKVLVSANDTAQEEYPEVSSVAYEQITAGDVGQQDSSGYAYKAVADGSNVKVTAETGVPYYEHTAGAGASRLLHLTQCTAAGNTNNERTTIGIGEVVDLSGMPGNTAWSVSGAGTISSTNGSGTTFTASLSPGSAKVTAQVEGAAIPTAFTIKAPDSVSVLSQVDWPPGTNNTDGTLMGAETDYLDAIGPTNVSFNNVLFRENPEPSSMNVTWPNRTNSIIHFNRTSSGWYMSCGQYTVGDQITSPAVPTPLIPTSYLYDGTNYVNFSFGNSWTYQYQNDAGTWTDFYTLTYEVEYHGDNKQCHVIYLGKPGGWQGPY